VRWLFSTNHAAVRESPRAWTCPEKQVSDVVHWQSSTQVLSTFGREGFGACCRGVSRGSNPYAVGVRDRKRPDLAQQEWEMAEEWWHGWDEAHIGR